jgi:hypothetical protein
MKLRTLAAASAALGLMAVATTASAAVSILGTQAWNLDGPLLYGQSIIQDYDNPLAAGFTYVGDNPYTTIEDTYVRSGGLLSGESAPPPVLKLGADPNNLQPGDIVYETTEYQTVENGGYASIEALNNLYFATFSLYMGSPDTYNHVSFRLYNGNTLLQTLSGDDIWNGGENEDNGDQQWGRRIYYDMGDSKVTKIEFQSTGNSFEFDGLAATTATIPEPSTWTMMILGFGAAGAMVRARRRAIA